MVAAPSVRTSGPVLVVDDDADVRRAIARVLGRSGLAVVQAENGIAAKAAIDLHNFTAIVCDIRMEVMNGLELYDQLRASRPDLAQRLVFVTGFGDDPEIRAALEQAGRPVLWKPFEVQALVNLVRHLAEQRPDLPGSTGTFSLAEMQVIRERALAPGGTAVCPCCGGELLLSKPVVGPDGTGLIWQLRCRRCARGLTLSGVPESGPLPPEPPGD